MSERKKKKKKETMFFVDIEFRDMFSKEDSESKFNLYLNRYEKNIQIGLKCLSIGPSEVYSYIIDSDKQDIIDKLNLMILHIKDTITIENDNGNIPSGVERMIGRGKLTGSEIHSLLRIMRNENYERRKFQDKMMDSFQKFTNQILSICERKVDQSTDKRKWDSLEETFVKLVERLLVLESKVLLSCGDEK